MTSKRFEVKVDARSCKRLRSETAMTIS